MNSYVVIDSSAIISLFSADDSNHQIALNISKKIKQQEMSVMLPNEVFAETINIFGKKFGHGFALDNGWRILETKVFIFPETTSTTRHSALKIFEQQPSSVSFTDCLVMAFADEFETKEIFGFDEAFKKNGYIRVGIDNY